MIAAISNKSIVSFRFIFQACYAGLSHLAAAGVAPFVIASRLTRFSCRFLKFQPEFDFFLFKQPQNFSSCSSAGPFICKRAIKGDILLAKKSVQPNPVTMKALILGRAHIHHASAMCARHTLKTKRRGAPCVNAT